jgi:preprotein translocase subunit SecD
MTRNNRIILLIIMVIFVLSVCIVFPIGKGWLTHRGLRQGIDLAGGVDLKYQVQFSENATSTDKSAAIDRAVLTIRKRIDAFGVTEPIIQKLGNDRIEVQLPGFTDIDSAKKLVEQTGFLEFREVELNGPSLPVTLKDYLGQTQYQFFKTTETGNRIFTINVNDSKGNSTFQTVAFLTNDNGVITLTDSSGNVADNTTLSKYGSATSWIPSRADDGTQLTGAYLADAQAVMDNSLAVPKPAVSIKWNGIGSTIFDQIALRLHNPAGSSGAYALQYVIGIFLDNNLISAPQILQASYGGSGQISGSFTLPEAQNLANLLKSGALPVQLNKTNPVENMVSATLGTDSLNRSLRAGIIGIILVMLFMIAYYRALGVVATAALLVYGAISLTVFKLIPVTLTLPGIAGFVISVGMAVDANILIFERTREEMRLGRTLEAGVAEGFRRAWPSIRDSNISTFITCIILYWFGSHFGAFMVKGFALTLFLGVAVSMFSAIMVTRTFLVALIHNQFAKKILLGSVK